MNIVVILAAGDSGRTGKINKIFYPLRGKPLVFYTISAFDKHPLINKIILVGKKTDFKKFTNLDKKYRFRKIVALIEGGKTRQESAFNGLKKIEKSSAKSGDIVLFHNGCNPLVSKKEINELVKATKKYKAAVLAKPVSDTIKKADGNQFISNTIPRENIYTAQTPQAIEFSLARRAFLKAIADKFQGTDDVMLIERLGKKVKIVPTSQRNIKITYAEDFELLKLLLNK